METYWVGNQKFEKKTEALALAAMHAFVNGACWIQTYDENGEYAGSIVVMEQHVFEPGRVGSSEPSRE